jgi:hypothetical protein
VQLPTNEGERVSLGGFWDGICGVEVEADLILGKVQVSVDRGGRNPVGWLRGYDGEGLVEAVV